MVQIKLSNIITSLENKLDSKSRYSLFTDEYIMSNVTEQKLLENGFEFKGYDNSKKYPIYRFENIEGIFDKGVLHLYQL